MQLGDHADAEGAHHIDEGVGIAVELEHGPGEVGGVQAQDGFARGRAHHVGRRSQESGGAGLLGAGQDASLVIDEVDGQQVTAGELLQQQAAEAEAALGEVGRGAIQVLGDGCQAGACHVLLLAQVAARHPGGVLHRRAHA